MNEDRFLRGLNAFVLGWLLGVAILGLFGCASAKAMGRQARDTSIKAIPVAVVVVLTGPLGLGVQAVATVGTLVITDLFTETAALSSGEKTGEVALNKEHDRWKGRTPQEWEEQASLASQAAEWLSTLINLGAAVLVGLFALRNRHNFRDLGLWNGLIHSIFGGKAGKAIGH